MHILEKLLGRTRLYKAISFAHDEYMRRQVMAHPPSAYAHFGEHTVVQRDVLITHPGRVYLGDWTTIQNQTFVNSTGGLHVGDYVGIGYRSTILTFNHVYRKAKAIPFDNHIQLKPVIIRDFAWVGWCSCLMPGVEIGEGAVVSMGSVVVKNVPPLAIVLGNPAEVIGYRSEDHFRACKEAGRTNPHRILEIYGEFEEEIVLTTRKRYARELREMGLITEAD